MMLIAAVFLFYREGIAQDLSSQQNQICVTSTPHTASIPTFGTVRCLAIWARFPDDHYDDPNGLWTVEWPVDTTLIQFRNFGLPTFARTFLSPTVQSSYPAETLSEYFRLASNGNLNLIGTSYPKVVWLSRNSDTYDDFRTNAAKEIMDTLAARGFDFTPYANGMIIVCFRFWNRTFQGVSGAFPSGTWGGVTFTSSSGILNSNCVSFGGTVPIVAHEIGHNLGYSHHAGIGNFGVMDGAGAIYFSAFERSLSNSGNHNWANLITELNATGIYTLPDATSSYYITKGSYTFESRGFQNFYETTMKNTIAFPNKVFAGKGLLITNTNRHYITESAEGRYDWAMAGYYGYPNYFLYPFIQYGSNPDGYSKMEVRIDPDAQTPDVYNPARNQLEKRNHPEALGTQKSFFDPTYNNVFSPYSNPKTDGSFAIEVLSQDNAGNIQFKYYANADIAQCAPAKPQDLKVFKPRDGQHPVLIWTANREPNLTGYNIYRNGDQINTSVVTGTSYTDYGVTAALSKITYYNTYTIKAVSANTKQSVFSDAAKVGATGIYNPLNRNVDVKPLSYSLSQNYPNPFNPATTISYSLLQADNVKLKVYDRLGREVQTLVNQLQDAGSYSIRFDASKLASGIYFYKLQAGGFTETKKMMLVK
jgi:hypothetical protein